MRIRLGLAALLVAAIAAGGLAYAYARLREEASRVTVAELFADRAGHEGDVVSLILEPGRRNDSDPMPATLSRSDLILHDDTGSIVVSGGWQIWFQWEAGRKYESDALDIDAGGTWRIKKALVVYDEAGVPYLELVDEPG